MIQFPEHYLHNAVASQMVRNARRGPLGSERLSGVQIALRDGTQRVMTFIDPDEAREVSYQFALQAMRAQGKTTA